MKKVGILALQGDILEHIKSFKAIEDEIEIIKVKKPLDLNIIDYLVLPGGESTVMSFYMQKNGLFNSIRKKIVQDEIKTMATCAGVILLSEEIKTLSGVSPESLGVLPIAIERNAYGRQPQSFVAQLEWQRKTFPGVFIRAPRVLSIKNSDSVKILSSYEQDPVFLQYKNILAMTFHPELTADLSIHKYFINS